MKRYFLYFLLILLVSSSGCSNRDVIKYNFSYQAENDNWKAVMPYKGTSTFYTDKDGTLRHKQDINSDLVVSYVGDEEIFAKLKKLEISYKSLSSGGTLTEEYDSEKKKKSFIFRDASGDAILDEDSVITVTIKMDGEVQTLELVAK